MSIKSRLKKLVARYIGIDQQPISNVEWVHPSTLRANAYNPNHVAPPEMELLELSIAYDGWTQPIVIGQPEDEGFSEIVDGFHRFVIGSTSEVIQDMTAGLVPVVRLNQPDPVDRRAATIRHNRARGTHAVVPMADIVNTLRNEYDVSPKEVAKLLGMESEEVTRLTSRGKMTEKGGKEWSKGWVAGDGEQ